jgi:hypothetical protein
VICSASGPAASEVLNKYEDGEKCGQSVSSFAWVRQSEMDERKEFKRFSKGIRYEAQANLL